MNPLENPLIITKILSFIQPVKQLKTLRLLNKTWNELAINRLTSKSFVNLNSPERIKLYLKKLKMLGNQLTIRTHRSLHINECDIIEEVEKNIFAIVKLTKPFELHFTSVHFLDMRHMLSTITDAISCSNTLTTISVNDIHFLSKNENSERNNNNNVELTNWSQITHFEFTDNFTALDETIVLPWKQILRYLTSLTTLHIQLMHSEEFSKVLKSLQDLKVVPPISDISSFMCNMTATQITKLASLNLPLKNLDFSLLVENYNCVKSVAQLLQSCAQSLEKCKILCDNETKSGTFEVPIENVVMRRLEYLEWMMSPVPIKLLKFCPRLTHLVTTDIGQDEFVKEIANPRISNRMGNNKTLENLTWLCVENEQLTGENLLVIGKAFPKIKSLYVFLDDERIQSVYQGFPDLEELYVLGNEVTDIGYVGWPMADCAKCKEEDGQNRASLKISDLKKLRKLCLYPQPQDELTDRTVLEGLIYMPELTFLDLPETSVSDSALGKLKNANTNLVYLRARIFIDPKRKRHTIRLPANQIV